MRWFGQLYNSIISFRFPTLLFYLTLLFPIILFSQPYAVSGYCNSSTVSFLNDRARDITGATAVNAPGFVVPGGLTGEGQIVAIADSGLDIGRVDDIHPDLRSKPGKMPKVVLLKSWAGREVPDDPSGHGTHMAATIAGTGEASDGKFRGVAPGASIYFQAILNQEGVPELPANLEDLFWPAYSAGARVHVNGWGGGLNTYGRQAAQVDEFIRENPDFLAVFGAGNSGPYPRSITTEANSKNALTVGASALPRPAFVPGEDSITSPAEFSSPGPAGDGRIKPELLAPGSAVISARSRLVEGNLPGYLDYTRLQGSSMAAAVAGGSAALMRDYLKKHQDIQVPSAALVKAALINGARSGPKGPSKEGFGTVDLAGTVIALEEQTVQVADEWAGVTENNHMEYTFQVTDSSLPFKATLVWTDPADEPGSSKALVNDLDMVVRTPDGRVYYGNHFTGSNAPDRTNNVEQVYLPTPVPGEYTVQVTAASIHKNTVRRSTVEAQDYALVWGQSPAETIVGKTDGRTVTLGDGTFLSTAEQPMVNLVNDNVAPVDTAHIFPGAAAFRTTGKAYLAARIWRAVGVRSLQTQNGYIFTEMSPSTRLGGYSLAPDTLNVTLNGLQTKLEKLPAGFEVNAVVNPVNQEIRNVQAAYIEREGVVSGVRQENGLKYIYLAGNSTAFRIAFNAVYSYEDTYDKTETEDMPFGTGALEELEEAMPGMPVRLRLAPSSGEVQYLAVKRTVALGTVAYSELSSGEIRLENGASYRIFSGAPVMKDRAKATIEAITPGDHVTAVLLPDTGEAIGLVAYSGITYGKVIDFNTKSRLLYLLDECGEYRSLYLPNDTIIYRWGVKVTADAIATGCQVRITTDPGGKLVWRLDIADTYYERVTLEEFDSSVNELQTTEENMYRVSGLSRFYKNGYPVPPEELIPGEPVELEYTVAPFPTGKVLVSANTRTDAPQPLLLSSVIPLKQRLVVTGKTVSTAAVYLWGHGCKEQEVPVNEDGSFQFTLDQEDEENINFTLVAVDRVNGGVAGKKVNITGGKSKGVPENTATAAFMEVIGIERDSVLPSRGGEDYLPDKPVTRAEMILTLARLFSWPLAGEQTSPFHDLNNLPAAVRPAVGEALARNIVKGYPDGSFLPVANLTRAEAAVIIAALMRDLRLDIVPAAVFYRDTCEIPPWALSAVAETTSAGLFPGRRNGMFAPKDPVTTAEILAALNRVLDTCESKYKD